MEKVIPPGLNYADIKPEAIENYIRVVKFTPQSTIVQAQPNDVVRFFIQGNGFYDPYSAYIRITVSPGADFTGVGAAPQQWKARLLDRSAHSLFSRLVIRSQGTELERIENYDVVAAMINDMVYSSEQRQLHHYEGFACNTITNQFPIFEDFGNIYNFQKLFHGSYGNTLTNVGDVGWWDVGANYRVAYAVGAQSVYDLNPAAAGPIINGIGIISKTASYTTPMFTYDGIIVPYSTIDPAVNIINNVAGALYTVDFANIRLQYINDLTFCVPIYSGIIGVLMPDKKLIPMSLMPLEVEFTMNPYAFYPAGVDTGRAYTVKKFEIFAHTLFFEYELHRSMEAIVAEHGIFIHYNSFYYAPVTQYQVNAGSQIPQYAQINVYAKSINSIHLVFLKTGFEALANAPRKLHFFSQYLYKIQLRNGLELTPSEPLEGSVNNSIDGTHSPFLIETYKAWNKMHDPSTDSNLNALNYTRNDEIAKPLTLKALAMQQSFIGRCQYGLSLEGEQLGQQYYIICGRKGLQPFDLNFMGTASVNGTYMALIFIRADYILYVRPDLVVTRLGV